VGVEGRFTGIGEILKVNYFIVQCLIHPIQTIIIYPSTGTITASGLRETRFHPDCNMDGGHFVGNVRATHVEEMEKKLTGTPFR